MDFFLQYMNFFFVMVKYTENSMIPTPTDSIPILNRVSISSIHRLELCEKEFQ